MNRPHHLVSLADLSAAGIRLRPQEAVTLARELMLQVARGEVAGVPSSHVIRLSAAGAITVEGPVAAGGTVARAAQLLDSLLPPPEAGAQFRVPGGLKLVLARALGTLDLPPFDSLDAFANALGRFAATDHAAMVTHLVVTWSQLMAVRPPDVEPAPAPALPAHVEPFVAPRALEARAAAPIDALTVSDIRRARRATGMPLAKVAERSRIPVRLLRQLEWGYLANWPAGQYGRTQLVRYARATGLDEQLVVTTLMPLLDEADRPSLPIPAYANRAGAAQPVIEVEVEAIPLAPTPEWPVSKPIDVRARRRARILAALAIPALIAIGVVPGWLAYSDSWNTRTAAAPGVQTAAVPQTLPAAGEPSASQPAAVEVPAPTTLAESGAASPPAVRDEGPSAAEPQRSGAGSGVRSAIPRHQAPQDGGGPAYRLAANGVAYSPAFGAVETAMFYQEQGAERSSLVRADTDGRGAVLRVTRIVDDDAQNFHVRPSPDGSRIAFDSDRDGVRGVYVANADGTNVRRVSPEGFAAVPSWSPDSSTLAFVRAKDDKDKVWNLWTLVLASGELRQITRHRYGAPWGGSWFPDGRRIAYSHETRLVIHDLETGREQVFASPKRGGLVRTPAVSPDGTRVMFQLHRDGAWLLELKDGSMRRILDDPTAEEYTWSPDGRRVAYHSRRSGAWGVWVMAQR